MLQEPPQNLNYFEIIGIKRDYNVANEEIHKKYRELQKMLHPDKFGNKSEASTFHRRKEMPCLLDNFFSKLTIYELFIETFRVCK